LKSLRRKIASFAVRNRHEKCQKACQSHGPNKKDIFVRLNPFRCRFELHWKRYHCSDCWKCRQIDNSHRLSIQYWYAFGFSDVDPGTDQENLLGICKRAHDNDIDEIFVHVQQGHICALPGKRPLVPGKTKNTDREEPVHPQVREQLNESLRYTTAIYYEPLSPSSSSETDSQGPYWEQPAYFPQPPAPYYNDYSYTQMIVEPKIQHVAEYQAPVSTVPSEYFIPWQHCGPQVDDPWVRMEVTNDYSSPYG
jgi:hypothetical protein